MEGQTTNMIFPLLLFLFALPSTYLSSSTSSTLAAAPAAASPPADFIRTSCKATSYPDVCVQSLASYAAAVRNDPRQLAHVATAISANRAHDTSSYLSGLSTPAAAAAPGGAKSIFRGGSSSTETLALDYRDCTVAMADSTRQLRKSVGEMERLLHEGGSRGGWFARRISNAQTWISAALTDQNACLSSLLTTSTKDGAAVIRKKVVEASRVTSNALSLVNSIDRLSPRN